jgi:SNF2 family DNA or RNA helicase
MKVDKTITVNKTKLQVTAEMINDLHRRLGNRVLVFSEFDFDGLVKELKAMHVNFHLVNGTTAHIKNTISEYNKGVCTVLLLSAKYFATGLNLQTTSHVFTMHRLPDDKYKQLIGRAQRPNRVEPLKVIDIRYESEMND